MPFNPTKQTAMNVGQVLQCDECGKWRLMHSKCKVKVNNDALTNVLETIMYTCGTSLSNIEDEELLEGIYTQSEITCNMPIELPHYSAKYEDICFYCGIVKHLDVQDASVYPICEGCKGI